MLFKGTTHRSGVQIAMELDSLGGFHNAFTGKETTCFHGRVLAKHFSKLAEILSDIFLNSIFDPLEIERERQVILQEISMVQDTPDEYIHEIFNAVLWKGHPLSLPILGDNETVSRITRDSILDFMKSHYLPDRILIVSAGGIEHEEVLAFFEPVFGVLDGTETIAAISNPEIQHSVSMIEKDLEQFHLCLGGEAPSLTDDKRFACGILNTLLGGNMSSRLFQEIREKRALAYSIYSFLNSFRDTGALGIYAATEPDKTQEALEVIRDEVSRIIDGDVSTSDLNAAKEHLVASLYLSSESADSRMIRLAKNELVYGRDVTYDEVIERLEGVSPEEVMKVAEKIFGNGRMALATLGPLEQGNIDSSIISFLKGT
jgi:predicted Zn-dependent peptidase